MNKPLNDITDQPIKAAPPAPPQPTCPGCFSGVDPGVKEEQFLPILNDF